MKGYTLLVTQVLPDPSCPRFGKLLQTDSVVLKETTPWIEYYYRSVKPNTHFIPFVKVWGGREGFLFYG